MVKQRKELCNVKSESTCWQVLDPTCLNDVYKRYICIYCRFELETTELAKVDEVICCHGKLESLSDNFLNKFAHCVE